MSGDDAGYLKAVTLLFRAYAANAQQRIRLLNRATYEVTVTARTRWLPGSNGSVLDHLAGGMMGRRSTGGSTGLTAKDSQAWPCYLIGFVGLVTIHWCSIRPVKGC
jgi:hypothetical protein